MDDKDINTYDDTTNVDDSRLSFGSYLKKARLGKGMSVEDIMDYTRISKFVVQQIEADNLSKLPEPVFLKGFLRTYAKAVGVDPEDVIQRYNRALGKEAQASENLGEGARSNKSNQGVRRISYKTVKPPREGRKGSPMKWVVLLILVIALAAGAYYYNQSRKKAAEIPAESVQTSQASGAEDKAKPELPPVPEQNGTEKAGTDKPAADSEKTGAGEMKSVDGYRLEVVCTEATTVKVSVDGGAPDEYSMKPGDHVDLKAMVMFNILIDDKCGASLFLNNNPVTLPGKCGQSVNIQLP